MFMHFWSSQMIYLCPAIDNENASSGKVPVLELYHMRNHFFVAITGSQ